MNNKIKLSLASSLLILSTQINADIKQSINLGLLNTSGNTDSSNINAKYDLGYTTVGLSNQTLKVDFDANALRTKSNGLESNKEYSLNANLEQYIDDSWLGYANVSWLKNKYKNFDNKYAIGAGIGKDLIKNSTQSLKIKLGVAQNMEEYSNEQDNESFTSLNQYVEYENQLNDVSKLYIKIAALENTQDLSDDYEVTTTAGLNFAVSKNINMAFEYEIKYDNLPSTGFDKTDSKTIARVGYSF